MEMVKEERMVGYSSLSIVDGLATNDVVDEYPKSTNV